MAATINASTASGGGVVTTADASGVLQLQTAGTTALTIDASQNVTLAKGLTVGATAAPAFSAYASASLNVTAAVATKVAINTITFDTASCFSTANNRFTPTVAGYYQVNGSVICTGGTTLTQVNAYLYKNGASVLRSGVISATLSTGGQTQAILSTLIYMNGTTDYLELWGMILGTGVLEFDYFLPTNTSSFSAALVRSA